MKSYEEFFGRATDGLVPYPYQARLANGVWPDLLDVPTGLGKTAAVTLAWLYRRRVLEQSNMPRRLVWCLPMRVLVEQTWRNATNWLRRLDLLGEPGESGRVSVHLMMGGEPDVRTASWVLHPEQEAILIGTQDMLLSRALMRGYGMSRYQWPVHFALLHNDAQWVFDEVQLMGPALATSAQLEGLRRSDTLRPERPTRSLWVSATLNRASLSTVDLRLHQPHFSVEELGESELAHPEVRTRIEAVKRLAPADTKLLATHLTRAGLLEYANALAAEVLAAHQTGTTTLVVLNTVERTQAVFDALLKARCDSRIMLVHARFRPTERRAIEQQIRDESGVDRIIIATQAIEAGVDLTSRTLFTELAPWASMVQRFGRCNRGGESPSADVFWVDFETDSKLAPPYAPADLDRARAGLMAVKSASSIDLPQLDEPAGHGLVLRRKDFLDLFNTDPDLSGFDIDISPYIRDLGTPQLLVFWRDILDHAEIAEQAAPERDELCPASVGQVREHLKGNKRQAWHWDGLTARWRQIREHETRPGMSLMLVAREGGYDADRGFSPGLRGAVASIGSRAELPAANASDGDTLIGCFVELTEHLQHVADAAARLASDLELPPVDAAMIETAGMWHDVGKAHEAFQHGLRKAAQGTPRDPEALLAKSDGVGRLEYAVPDGEGGFIRRSNFRHELASMLAWLEHGDRGEHHDLVAYLIAAHHGKVRLGLRALPTETVPRGELRFARGVWEGDLLPSVRLNGTVVPETILRLELMELGEGSQGASWTQRTQQLLATEGVFRLAWLETLVRIADWRASEAERISGAASS